MMIGYDYVKLVAEIVSLASLTLMAYSAYSLRELFRGKFNDHLIRGIVSGFLVVWMGYLVNVLNEFVPMKFLKIFDDVLVAIGLIIIVVMFWGLRQEITLSVSPVRVVNGKPKLQSGAFITKTGSPQKLLSLLSGKKLLVLTRNPQLWDSFGVPHIWVSNVENDSAISPTKLPIILHTIVEKTDEETFVIIDSLEYLILQNGEKSTLKFLLSLKDHVLGKGGGIILLVDPNSLNPHVVKIIEREFRPLPL